MDWVQVATDGGGWALAILLIYAIVRSGLSEPPAWVLGREHRKLQADYDTKSAESADRLSRLETMQQDERQRLKDEIARLQAQHSTPREGSGA